MSDFGSPLDLSFLDDDLQSIARLVEVYLDTAVLNTIKIGEGFYGKVYCASLTREPHRVIVKYFKYAGHAAQEAAQLDILRPRALVKIPHIYASHTLSEFFPGEALLMEYLPGVIADEIEFPDEKAQANFVESVVANLLAWHTCTYSHGFGQPQGPFYPTWQSYFGERISLYHQQLHQPKHRTTVSDFVLRLAAQSYEAFADIFVLAQARPSLVHGDYNIFNMLVDPVTYQLTGILDPLDAGWADYEIDLFHLANGRPEIGLLEHYLQQRPVEELFWLRYHFYRFWDDIKHYLRMGYYEEDLFSHNAWLLAEAMKECLLSR
jgi:aminoglycoside phosphotransferase (APT) family kinase protein